MKIQDLKTGALVKVIFKEHDRRFPMIGKFVYLNDATYLAEKGMIRFVNQSKLDYWKDESPNINLTKIYVVNDFAQVNLMYNGASV